MYVINQLKFKKKINNLNSYWYGYCQVKWKIINVLLLVVHNAIIVLNLTNNDKNLIFFSQIK